MKPPDSEVRALSAGWLAKARTDLLACDALFAQGAELWEAVAFHAQQTVEKALKAVLVAHQVEFSKTHDIERLLDLLAHAEPALPHAAADAARQKADMEKRDAAERVAQARKGQEQQVTAKAAQERAAREQDSGPRSRVRGRRNENRGHESNLAAYKEEGRDQHQDPREVQGGGPDDGESPNHGARVTTPVNDRSHPGETRRD